MRTFQLLLLTTCVLCVAGCGYSSHNGMMASSAPTINQLMPSSVDSGGPGFTLTAKGSNFVTGAVVYWNGGARTTKFLEATQVTAGISASDIAMAATVGVYVRNPGGTGTYSNEVGQPSNTMDFTVLP